MRRDLTLSFLDDHAVFMFDTPYLIVTQGVTCAERLQDGANDLPLA